MKKLIDDSWMYILLLSVITIFSYALRLYYFDLYNIKITYSVLLIPLIIFLNNYILKHYGSKIATISIFISGISMLIFTSFIKLVLGDFNLDILFVSISYIISMFINIYLYFYILKKYKEKFFLVLINYFITLIICFMFYTFIYISTLIDDNYWFNYLYTILLQFIISIPFIMINKIIKK